MFLELLFMIGCLLTGIGLTCMVFVMIKFKIAVKKEKPDVEKYKSKLTIPIKLTSHGMTCIIIWGLIVGGLKMKNIILTIKDPEFLSFIELVGASFIGLVGAIVLIYNLILNIKVESKNRQAETYLHQTAKSFKGMATGLIFISFYYFLIGDFSRWFISFVFACLAFCRKQYLRRISRDNDALQKVQDMLNKKR